MLTDDQPAMSVKSALPDPTINLSSKNLALWDWNLDLRSRPKLGFRTSGKLKSVKRNITWVISGQKKVYYMSSVYIVKPILKGSKICI